MRSSYEVERWGDSVHAPIVFSACERYSPVISLEYLIAAKCSFLTVPFDAKLAVRSHISIIKPSLCDSPDTATTRGITDCPAIVLTKERPVHAVRTCSRATRTIHKDVVGE